MTLEQYEAMLAEKKAELNKARVVRTIDASEFANLKVINKDEEEEENPLEVRVEPQGFGSQSVDGQGFRSRDIARVLGPSQLIARVEAGSEGRSGLQVQG
jgi:hypothetical protein